MNWSWKSQRETMKAAGVAYEEKDKTLTSAVKEISSLKE